jgi:hypothetical protein
VTAATLVGLRAPGINVSASGLQIERELSFEEWEEIGQQLVRMHGASCWAIGDWAHHGEGVYGRRYEQAIEATGLSYQTVRDYAYVAGRFDLSRRHDNLSFQHHREVAALSPREQDHWLQLTENESLSSRQLREAMTSSRSVGRGSGSTLPALSLKPISPEEVAAWNEAAEREGLPLADWARRVLDKAAGAG